MNTNKIFFLILLIINGGSMAFAGSVVQFEPDGTVSVNGERKFIYGTFRDPSDDWTVFTGIQEAGFNLTHDYYFETKLNAGYTSTNVSNLIAEAGTYLDLAANNNVGVFLGIPREIVFSTDTTALGQFVNALKNKPALWFWYLMENPGNYVNISSKLQTCYTYIKSIDTNHPIVIAEKGKTLIGASTLGQYCDMIWVNDNCIPYGYLSKLAEIDSVESLYPPHPKLVMSVIHATDSLANENRQGMHPAKIKLNDNSTNIDRNAIHGQAQASIAAGAKGILCYYNSEKHNIKNDTPAVWQAIVELGQEMSNLEPVLLSNETVPNFSLYEQVWGRTLRMRDLYGDDEVTPAPGYPTKYLKWWTKKYNNELYVGFIADFMPLNRMHMTTPYQFSSVVQYPGGNTVIKANGSSNPTIYYNLCEPAIWDVKNNSYIQFVINEKDSFVWKFAIEGISGDLVYSDDFTGTDGTSLNIYNQYWTIAGGIAQLRNNKLYLGTLQSGNDSDNNVLYYGTGSNTWEDYTVSVDMLSTRNFATTGSSTLYAGLILYGARESVNTDRLWGYQVRLRDLDTSPNCRLYISKRLDGTGSYDLNYIDMPDWVVNGWFNITAAIVKNNGNVSINVVMKNVSDGTVIGTVSALDDGSVGGAVFNHKTFGFNSAMSYSASDYHTEWDNLKVYNAD
ncbi:MAG: hypothetical protein A2Y10_05665 [Planctomycetes bacterium GWF2_41_51]|nr:MAG: hypothetical protein A2Y10_05665 [Planctomycetes bacterium GWF2_41_51]